MIIMARFITCLTQCAELDHGLRSTPDDTALEKATSPPFPPAADTKASATLSTPRWKLTPLKPGN
jgi:hypothetical protein